MQAKQTFRLFICFFIVWGFFCLFLLSYSHNLFIFGLTEWLSDVLFYIASLKYLQENPTAFALLTIPSILQNIIKSSFISR